MTSTLRFRVSWYEYEVMFVGSPQNPYSLSPMLSNPMITRRVSWVKIRRHCRVRYAARSYSEAMLTVPENRSSS